MICGKSKLLVLDFAIVDITLEYSKYSTALDVAVSVKGAFEPIQALVD